MKKQQTCLIVMLVISTFSLFFVPSAISQVNEPQNIQVVNKSWYLDLYGNLVVVGQIQNIGQDVIQQVVLTGIATTNDQTQQSSYTVVWGAELVPQQKAPFYMEFFVPQSSFGQGTWYNNVANVDLTVASANSTSGYQYPDLKIVNDQGSVGTSGNFNGAYVVSGSVENTGSQSAQNITVVGTFFNSTGAVVGVGYTNYLSPRTLNPSESASFQVAALDLNQSEVPSSLKITKYELLVQAQGPILQGNAPVATPYSGSSGGTSNNPTPTLAPGQTSSSGSNTGNLLIYASAAAAVVIVVIVVAFVFIRKRRTTQPDDLTVEPAKKPVYKPKPSRRNRK
jgi:hypothetical protein